ncbi:MAG: molybdopterin-guanine dinucleotide biosynthesis protein MobA [Actinobacteria bacterium]|nr:molybdopterin-guanine dinucleotide biosynthesis protein MobA [Actinomycetota bacterium]
MSDWVDRLAQGLGVEPLSALETVRLLSTAREVAHRVERSDTPLAAFVLGAAVGRRVAEGVSHSVAFDDALDALVRRLPSPPEEPA